MKKIFLLYAAFFLLFILSVFTFLNFKNIEVNPTQVQDYENGINTYSDSLILNYEIQQQEYQNSVFSSNFEGPKISIEYLSHRGKIWDEEQLPKFSFTPQSINFDPDWASYGLPNLHIEVAQPQFVNAVNSENTHSKYFEKVKNQLGILSETGPVKSYSKTYKNEEGKLVKEYFDLYLTKFNITIGVKPIREAPMIKPTSEERHQKSYPKHWYQDIEFSKGKLVSLDDLRQRAKEGKNHRYAQVECVFKIDPNQLVNYTGNPQKQTRADVAIGEIITQQIKTNFNSKAGYQQAHLNPSAPGLSLDLFSEPTLNNRHNPVQLKQNQFPNTANSIFNKAVYFRIQSNNIGSWDKKGLFFGTEWDDQFTITCLMPILVKGKFEVVLDSKFRPSYIPNEAYFNHVSFSDIIPDWGLSRIGKYISYGFIVFIHIVAILFIPQLFTLINAVFKRMAHKIKTPPNS